MMFPPPTMQVSPYVDVFDPAYRRRVETKKQKEREAVERVTPWLSFRCDRMLSFAKQLRQRGFVYCECGHNWTISGTYITWNPYPFFDCENNCIDAVLIRGVFVPKQYRQRGHGGRMMRAWCDAMDNTNNGVCCVLVPRVFEHGKDDEAIYPENDQWLSEWYQQLGWSDSGVKTPEERTILVRFSPNFIDNPHNEQEGGRGNEEVQDWHHSRATPRRPTR